MKNADSGTEITIGSKGNQKTVLYKEGLMLFSVRIPRDLQRMTKAKAAEEGRTLSEVVTSMMLDYVGERFIPFPHIPLKKQMNKSQK